MYVSCITVKFLILEAAQSSFALWFTCSVFQRGEKLPEHVKEALYSIADDNHPVNSNSSSLCFHSGVPRVGSVIYDGPDGIWQTHTCKGSTEARSSQIHI